MVFGFDREGEFSTYILNGGLLTCSVAFVKAYQLGLTARFQVVLKKCYL